MLQRAMTPLSKRWLSLKITEKFGVVFILLLLIGMAETGISLAGLRIVESAANSAQTSLDIQRMSLEMSRDWEVLRNYEYRFFTQYQEISYPDAKEQYALPAGETLSNIIRLGAALRRMTSAPDASENLHEHDAILRQYLSDISAYAVGLENAVQLASDTTVQNEQQIQEQLAKLDSLTGSIEPNFTHLILMAQYEVANAQFQIERTQQIVSIILILANMFGIVLIGLLIYALNKNISINVARLTRSSARMQQGHLEERVIFDSADEFGQIGTAFNSMATSIQERTEALGESESRYRELVNAAPYCVFVLRESKIVYANPACLKTLNYSLEDMVGLEILAITDQKDHILVRGWTQHLTPGDAHEPVEISMLSRDGQTLFLEIVAAPISFDHMPAILGIGQDITQRKKMEKAIIETEKLAGIGTLAAGIAHEINTPLQIITGYSGSIRRNIKTGDLLQDASLDKKVASIERNGWRIAAIVQSLLAYARPSADQVDSHALNEIVEETLLLIEHQLRSWSNISIEKELAADLPPLKCDSNRITQVLINLLTNAADAMPDGGWIVIRTEFDEDNQQLTLKISDTGGGIPENLQSRIFDPFFTTKEVGMGTGLGLSIVQGIVEAHSGEISLQSQMGKGTTVTIALSLEPLASTSNDLAHLEVGRYDG
jgi:PAS domain S-box-containing protein